MSNLNHVIGDVLVGTNHTMRGNARTLAVVPLEQRVCANPSHGRSAKLMIGSGNDGPEHGGNLRAAVVLAGVPTDAHDGPRIRAPSDRSRTQHRRCVRDRFGKRVQAVSPLARPGAGHVLVLDHGRGLPLSSASKSTRIWSRTSGDRRMMAAASKAGSRMAFSTAAVAASSIRWSSETAAAEPLT